MNKSIFSTVTAVPDDPILSLTGKFLADPRDCKVNLGVGMYLDEKCKVVTLVPDSSSEKQGVQVNDEILEIKHIAYSRSIYSRGALKAAKFIINKPAGYYTMNDLI